MNKHIVFLLLAVSAIGPLYSQSEKVKKENKKINIWLSPGYTYGYSTANLGKLQSSFDSYLHYAEAVYAGDALTNPGNWQSGQLHPGLSFHLGASGMGAYFSVTHFRFGIDQSRSVLRASGYGRRFDWKERRREWLFDVGYGGRLVDIFGSFGINGNTYKMVSYQLYPGGVYSVNAEYPFNGVFRNLYTGGISFGGGIKIRPYKYIALDLRYIYGKASKEAKIGRDPGLSDNADSRDITKSNEFPADYTRQPLNQLDNYIVPNFSRHYFAMSVLFNFQSK
ncbi:hypothetical protein [Parapedobacter sp. 2B3]|uniref:hypothetical protein n=1 Tax=Parapedobacter sp. 2B3 TaxID=3342381 RepID=UPI0035B63704